MIASFSNDFVFVKTRKVGGTSVEIVLSSWCEGCDIVTPITPEDEQIRISYGGRAMNFHDGGTGRFFNHMPAARIRQLLPEFWDRAFTFAIDRHPYEKVVSRAWWNIARRGGDAHSELAAEIDCTIESAEYLNFPLYCDRTGVIVKALWRSEDMWDRLAELARSLGRSLPADLPRAKSQFRHDRRPAHDVLTENQKRKIASDAVIEFKLLGYKT